MTNRENNLEELIRNAREVLSYYGRDYSIGAVRGLATRNMVRLDLPELSENFFPIVKVHEMALMDLEEIFYAYLQDSGDGDRDAILRLMVEEKIWE
ncbi:MAG: hypothetical protein GXP52_07975 [Deltaproteobacteria bacterium]|nr:hypothetical protein [Deltaproteobacteria bacterium]